MTDTPTAKFRSRSYDEFGLHILEDIAQNISTAEQYYLDMFAEIGGCLGEIDALLEHDVQQTSVMKKSRGVMITVDPANANEVKWTVRAFRDPVRLVKLTYDGRRPVSEAYLRRVSEHLCLIRDDLHRTAAGGGAADLACNKGLRRFFIESLRLISHDLDFELVYNVYANSNLTGDTSKPDWRDLIDYDKKNPPTKPRGGGPNNSGGTPRGAHAPLTYLHTDAVAKQAA